MDQLKDGDDDDTKVVNSCSNCGDDKKTTVVEIEDGASINVDCSSVQNPLNVDDRSCDTHIPKEDLLVSDPSCPRDLASSHCRLMVGEMEVPDSPSHDDSTSLPDSGVVEVLDLPSTARADDPSCEETADPNSDATAAATRRPHDAGDFKMMDTSREENNVSYLNNAVSNCACDSEGDNGDGFVLLPVNSKLLLLDEVVQTDGYLANNMCRVELSCPRLVNTLRLDGNLQSMHENRSTL